FYSRRRGRPACSCCVGSPSKASRSRSRDSASLASLLHVLLNEFLRVFFQDVVDFIQQGVELFLELLALLRDVGGCLRLSLLGVLLAGCAALLLGAAAAISGHRASLPCVEAMFCFPPPVLAAMR